MMVEEISGRKLRVALILDSFIQPEWVHSLVLEIKDSDVLDLSLIIKKVSAPGKRVQPHSEAPLLWKIYSALDQRTRSQYPDPFATLDLSASLNGCRVESVASISGNDDDLFAFAAPDLDRIKAMQLDVAIDLCAGAFRQEDLNIARWGIWSCEPANGIPRGFVTPGAWEALNGDTVTELNLVARSSAHPRGIKLATYTTSTDRFSAKANRNKHYWKAPLCLIRSLRELQKYGMEFQATDYADDLSNPVTKAPTNAMMAGLLVKQVHRRFKHSLNEALRNERWYMAYTLQPFDPIESPPRDFFFMEPPKDRFWADPFPILKDDKYYIFMEEFIYEKMMAHLSVIEMNLDGNWDFPIKILECDHHLSYPFVFEWDERLYMIPETKKANRIALYRCEDFPLRWEFDRVLIDNVPAVDATLHQHGGLWWLFCAVGGRLFPSNDELHLFYAETPLGPWAPHARNPVKTDVRSSRPAGRLFSRDGDLFRPAQDCSERMGGAISINRVVELTTEVFKEQKVAGITPAWKKGTLGVHTINRAGNLTVLDCFDYVTR
jgi:hypothetical protein